MKASARFQLNKIIIKSCGQIACLLALRPAAGAFEPPIGQSFQIHGFLSQAYLRTDENNFFGQSKGGGSFDFRELGLNASWLPHSKLLAAAQCVSRWAGEGDNGRPRIDYGFLDYKPVSNPVGAVGIRLGRILNPLGIYNETRDAAFTRPSILLPQSIYFDRVRDVALSSDGVQAYGEYRRNLGDISMQAGVGKPRVEGEETELALLGADFPGELRRDASYIWKIGYDKDGGLIRAAVSGATVNIEYDSGGSGDILSDGDITFSPLIYSLQYGPERWSLTAEYARRSFKLRNLGFLDSDTTGESWYVQGTLKLTEELESIVRRDVLFTDRDDRDGKDFERATNGAAPAHSRFAKDWTIGFRYDITPSVMLMGEFHSVDGTAWITRLDNPDDLNKTERRWRLYSLLVCFRF